MAIVTRTWFEANINILSTIERKNTNVFKYPMSFNKTYVKLFKFLQKTSSFLGFWLISQ